MALVLTLLAAFGSGYQIVQKFQTLPTDGEDYLSSPSGFVFSPTGRLYLADSTTARVHVWNKDGDYAFSFGKQGQGPGEMQNPTRADFAADSLWVLDITNRLTRYDQNGQYLSSFQVVKPRLRNFVVLDEHRFLLTTREQVTDTEIYNRVEQVDSEGQILAVLMRARNESFVSPRRGDNIARVKVFPPAVDLQRSGNTVYFGFSQTRVLHHLGAGGDRGETLTLSLPSEKPTDDEIEVLKELELPCFGGNTFVLADYPSISQDFSQPKAYYTNFSIQEDRIILSRTPDGGVFSCEGYPSGEYFVCDLTTGDLIDRGRFDLGKGALLFFRHDKILAILNSDDDYEVAEIRFGD